MTTKMTVKEFQTLHGLKNPAEANGIINFLVSQGHATHVENRRTTSGKGKPAKVYELKQTVTLNLFDSSDIEEINKIRDEQDHQIATEKAAKEAAKEAVESSKSVPSETSDIDNEDAIDPNGINLNDINLDELTLDDDHLEFEDLSE